MALSGKLFVRFRQELRIRNRAPATIKSYQICLRAYVRFLHPRLPREAGAEDVRAFLEHSLACGLSRSYLDQSISALKFLYVELYGRADEGFAVPRPKREQKLPVVPTRAEVIQLAEALLNRRHRMAVLFIYACGLRVSELVKARVGDVNLEKLTMRVREGKGLKDRVTVVAAVLVPELRALCGDRGPQEPLLPAQHGGRWTARSCERVLAKGCLRGKLPLHVTPHSLRHAFATDLLEAGTDIKLIQALLGHARAETTRRYARLRNPATLNVRSPL